MTGSNVEFKIYAAVVAVLLIAIGFIIVENSNVVVGPQVPMQHVEFSEMSFNNLTNVLTVNATLKVIYINEVNPKYRKTYFEVKGPFAFNQAEIFSIEEISGTLTETPITVVNLTAPIELIEDKPSTIVVNLDRSIASGNYSVRFKLPNDGTYYEHFTVP